MPRKQSTPKETAVTKYVEFIITTYKPREAPIVLMWREVVTAYELQLYPDHPPRWPRDSDDVHRHWKQFGVPTAKVLRQQYKLTVVKVNRSIRDVIGHGKAPDQSTKKNEAAYAKCLPSSSSPVFGMVVFPRDTSQDHPLIVLSNQRRCQAAGNTVKNSIDNVRTTNDLGCLSDDTAKEIVASTRKVVSVTFDEERYPLFRQLTEQPKG